ncbi:MAG: DinB family protein [Ginsengibacter sp.]
MDIQYISKELAKNKNIFKSIFENTEEQEYLWKPLPNKWCLLEILCHLYDEEREDFRARIQHTFENPAEPMKPIDPVGWVLERKYIEQDYKIILEKFLSERDKSVEWLNDLPNAKWNNIYYHSQLGEISAAMFLSAWLAHDYLHIRQITRTKYQYLQSLTGHDLSYAGKW